MADAPNVVKIQNARLSYPYVYKARGTKKDKDPRYEASFQLDPSNAAHAKKILELKVEAANVAKAKFGDKVDLKKLKLPFRTLEEDDAFSPGWFVLSTWNKDRPLIVNRDNKPTAEGDHEAVFGGCYVNTNTTFFAWEFVEDGMTKRGVSANLRSIQFVKGTAEDRFGGGTPVSAEDEFEAIGEAAEVAGGAADPFGD